MKKITLSLLFFLIGFLGLMQESKAQTTAIPVPTYQNRSEMPAKMNPKQKMLRQLPKVIINETGADLATFTTEMNQWVMTNPALISQFEEQVTTLIEKKQFDQLADILTEMGHTKELSLNINKGGQHE